LINLEKNCLWRGKDFNQKKYNLAAWDIVRRPKDKGGLGVIDLATQNNALLPKQLDKFYRRRNIQRVSLIWNRYYNGIVPQLSREKGSFWWKDIWRLHVIYRRIATCFPTSGDTISFWDDVIQGEVQADVFPNLFSFAKDRKISYCTLRQSADLLGCFRIPMTRSAYNEFIQLQLFLDDMPPVEHHEPNSWSLIWGQHFYSPRKFYQHQYKDLHPKKSITWVWKSKCVPTIKFFAWLLLNDRLNTRNILRRRRKHLDEGYSCVLCHENIEETVEHLFFDCSSAITR
jgi:hypothetical protein